MIMRKMLDEKLHGSLVDGTNDREARPKRWIAALVQMNTEKKVGQKLDKVHIENYVPVQSEIHQWSDRRKKIDRIVIPMVVFVKTDEETEKLLRTYTFIYRFVSYPGESVPAIIPQEQIDRLRYMLYYADSKVELADASLQVGESVRIVRGPLKGFEGELCYIKPDKPMVAIRIECLGYACVNVAKADVESIQNK